MSATGLLPAWCMAPPPAALAQPVLSVHALRYVAEGRPGALPAIAGLRLQAMGIANTEHGFDSATGLTFLRDLPPGPRRILVTDPQRRYLPAALTVVVPSRFAVRPTASPPGEASQYGALRGGAPLRVSIRLRPSPSRAVPDGMTAVIGRLRDQQGRGIALGRLECTTLLHGQPVRLVTWTDTDGSFALLLPGEAPRLDMPPPPPVARRLEVRVPVPALAAALAADFLGALPDGLDGMAAEQVALLFTPCAVQLRAADGAPGDQPPGLLPIRPGRSIRWDLVAPH
ncbi:hypothetical protein [Falsiroseomonas sp.]|uniref:hypothetical protein n=1 Tax=Falsiroseomonas sp. TaxID=2870721 RepID=UPI002716366D|nr:hypothetical protein [Falsiroseomonas sp.]MDO9501092.1 hypothetical protein [Falsiroseomonas sp.]